MDPGLEARRAVDMRAFGYLLRDHWKLIALVTVLAVAVGALFTARMKPRYASSVTFYVSASTRSTDPALAYQGILLAQQAVLSYSNLLTDPRLTSSVVRQLRLPMTASQVSAEIKATPVPQTVLLTATVTDASPRRAQLIAAAVGTQFVKLIAVLQRPVAGQQPTIQAVVVDPASRPGAPVSPKPARNIAIALVIGLVIGIALAAFRRSLDTTVKSVNQLSGLTGWKPVIGTVPFHDSARKHPLAEDGDIPGYAVEAYRKLRANLRFLNIAAPSKVVLFTSALPNEGKTSVVCGVALALARLDQRVIVVETDLRRPRAANYLGLPRSAGLTDVLAGEADLDDVIQKWGKAPIDLLDAGPMPPNPSDLLASQRMTELIARLRQCYDMVLLDACPVLPFADATAIAPASDGAILVVRFGKARTAQVRQATEALSAVGTSLIGSVLTMTPARPRPEYGYGHSGHHLSHNGSRPWGVNEQPDQARSAGAR